MVRRTVASKWSKIKKINEINKKILTVRRTVGSKWAKIQKGKQNKLETLTVYIFTLVDNRKNFLFSVVHSRS